MFTQDKTYEISALAWGQEIIFYICFWSLFCLPWLQIRNSVSFRTSHLDWRIQGGSSARTCQGSPAVEAPENIFWKCLKCDKKKCDRTWREPTEQSHWEYIDFDVKLRDLVLHIVAFELVVVDVQVGDHSVQPLQPRLNQYQQIPTIINQYQQAGKNYQLGSGCYDRVKVEDTDIRCLKINLDCHHQCICHHNCHYHHICHHDCHHHGIHHLNHHHHHFCHLAGCLLNWLSRASAFSRM